MRKARFFIAAYTLIGATAGGLLWKIGYSLGTNEFEFDGPALLSLATFVLITGALSGLSSLFVYQRRQKLNWLTGGAVWLLTLTLSCIVVVYLVSEWTMATDGFPHSSIPEDY